MNTHIHFDIGSSSLGCVLVALHDGALSALLLGDSPQAVTRELRERFPGAHLLQSPERAAHAVGQAVELADGRRRALDLKLGPAGTEFQQRVWDALRRIPPGSTASYSDIARRIAAPTACRAVAQACGANPLALVIPCHRVVRSDGALSGYRWGIARKRALLEREAHGRATRPVAR